jgi:hypothetical protein
MDSNDYYKALDNVCKDLKSGAHAELLITIANAALYMIKSRVQNTGFNATGNRFRKYSEWYDEYKTEKGKNKGFTDFSFTNRMWTNIQLVNNNDKTALITAKDKGSTGSKVQIEVTRKRTASKRASKNNPKSTYTKQIYIPSNYEKLEKNTERFGSILELSEKEIKILKQQYTEGIMDIFRKHGLA